MPFLLPFLVVQLVQLGKHFLGDFRLSLPAMDDSQLGVSGLVLGIERARLLQMRQGIIQPILLEIDLPHIIEGTLPV
jgi:hypothetical protein